MVSSKMPAQPLTSLLLSDRPMAYRVSPAVDDHEPNGGVTQKMCWSAPVPRLSSRLAAWHDGVKAKSPSYCEIVRQDRSRRDLMLYAIQFVRRVRGRGLPHVLRTVNMESAEQQTIKRHAAGLLRTDQVPEGTEGVIVRHTDGTEIFRWSAEDGEYRL
jgi:hypothetical protein